MDLVQVPVPSLINSVTVDELLKLSKSGVLDSWLQVTENPSGTGLRGVFF